MARRFDQAAVSPASEPRASDRAVLRGPMVPIVVVTSLFLLGCQATLPVATSQPAPPRDRNAELIMYISDQPYVTADPAYRAVHVLATGQAFGGEFEQLAETMRSDGLIGKGWHHASDQPLDRAAVGFMVCRACKIRTGLNWNLTGLGRYAWRELIYHNIAEGGSEFGLMSGGEFVGVLSRADDYLRRTGQGEQRAELGPRER